MSINLAPTISPSVFTPSNTGSTGTTSTPRVSDSNPNTISSSTADRPEEASSRQGPYSDSVSGLSNEERKRVAQLKKIDNEVRTHEMAHIAAGGQYVTSGARLEYIKGPDGVNYAVAGEVSIDTSPIPGDPKATAEKMKAVQRAALAPASPSAQDRKVAARAGSEAAKATAELMLMQAKEKTSEVFNTAHNDQRGSNAYASSQNLDTTKGAILDIII